MRPSLGLALISLWTLCAFQQTPIRVEVEAVNVLVSVTDKKNQFITDLPKNRFRIYEDGQEQVITNFRHETSLPLRIGLLIDTSSSVRLKLEFEKRAATRFVHSILRPRDKALLVEFDSGVSLLHDFTSNPRSIAKAIQGLRAGGGTALMDALHTVSSQKMTNPNSRQAMIVLSDGVDHNSKHNLDETLADFQRSGITLYSIGTSRFGADQQKKGEKTLRILSEKTGGRAFFPYSVERLQHSFDLINEELRSQYSLTYISSNRVKNGKFRKIDVKLHSSKGLTVRHRNGYYSPKPTQDNSQG